MPHKDPEARRKYYADWYEKNKERVSKYNAEKYIDNKKPPGERIYKVRVPMSKEEKREKGRAYMAAWRAANPEKAYNDKHRERSREYRLKNRDKYNAKSTAWRKANPEKMKASLAASYKSHKEKRNADSAAWYESNKERVKEISNAWHKENPDKVRSAKMKYKSNNKDKLKAYVHNRNARKKSVGGKLSPDIIQKLLVLQKGKCAACKADLKKTGYHLDHIVPLSKGGRNDDRNVQLTCPTCNLKKGNKDPIQFMQELGYLL